MRVSVDPNDPGYNRAALGCKVFFDGAEISGVFTADEEKRFVLVHKRDEKGNYMLTPDRQEVATETRYGHVRVEMPAKEPVNRPFYSNSK